MIFNLEKAIFYSQHVFFYGTDNKDYMCSDVTLSQSHRGQDAVLVLSHLKLVWHCPKYHYKTHQ